MRKWRSCSPQPRPQYTISQCLPLCNPTCLKTRRRCRSSSPTRGTRPFYVRQPDDVCCEPCDPCDSTYKVRRASTYRPICCSISPPKCDPCEWRTCSGSPSCCCWRCLTCNPRRYRMCPSDRCDQCDSCYLRPSDPCYSRRCDPCYPRRGDVCYSRVCDPFTPSRSDRYYLRRFEECEFPRRCDPCQSPYMRRCSQFLQRSPCEPYYRLCSPLRCRPNKGSPCEPCCSRRCEPCSPCLSPSSSSECPVEERVIKNGRLLKDTFMKLCYPKCLPCRTFTKNNNKCISCAKEACNCVDKETAGQCDTGTITAIDDGPSPSYMDKSRKLGKNADRFAPHHCPWEADITISGIVHGHCPSTAAEVARKMTGRFKSSGDRCTLDSQPKQDSYTYEPQRINIGYLDDGTELNLTRDRNLTQRFPSKPVNVHTSSNQYEIAEQESTHSEDQSSGKKKGQSCQANKSIVDIRDGRSSFRDYNISCSCTAGGRKREPTWITVNKKRLSLKASSDTIDVESVEGRESNLLKTARRQILNVDSPRNTRRRLLKKSHFTDSIYVESADGNGRNRLRTVNSDKETPDYVTASEMREKICPSMQVKDHVKSRTTSGWECEQAELCTEEAPQPPVESIRLLISPESRTLNIQSSQSSKARESHLPTSPSKMRGGSEPCWQQECDQAEFNVKPAFECNRTGRRRSHTGQSAMSNGKEDYVVRQEAGSLPSQNSEVVSKNSSIHLRPDGANQEQYVQYRCEENIKPNELHQTPCLGYKRAENNQPKGVYEKTCLSCKCKQSRKPRSRKKRVTYEGVEQLYFSCK